MRLYKSTRVNLAEMIGAEQADGASQLYLKDLWLRRAQFASRFNGFIANITSSEIDDWLRGLAVGARTRNNDSRRRGTVRKS